MNQSHLNFVSLSSCVSIDNIESVTKLLDDADIGIYDKNNTPCILASSGSIEMSKLLIKHGAHINTYPILDYLIQNIWNSYTFAVNRESSARIEIYLKSLDAKIENIKYMIELNTICINTSLVTTLRLFDNIIKSRNVYGKRTTIHGFIDIINCFILHGAVPTNVKHLLPVYKYLSNSILCKLISYPMEKIPLEIIHYTLSNIPHPMPKGTHGYSKCDVIIQT